MSYIAQEIVRNEMAGAGLFMKLFGCFFSAAFLCSVIMALIIGAGSQSDMQWFANSAMTFIGGFFYFLFSFFFISRGFKAFLVLCGITALAVVVTYSVNLLGSHGAEYVRATNQFGIYSSLFSVLYLSFVGMRFVRGKN